MMKGQGDSVEHGELHRGVRIGESPTAAGNFLEPLLGRPWCRGLHGEGVPMKEPLPHLWKPRLSSSAADLFGVSIRHRSALHVVDKIVSYRPEAFRDSLINRGSGAERPATSDLLPSSPKAPNINGIEIPDY